MTPLVRISPSMSPLHPNIGKISRLLENKVALVTGAARGLGASHAFALASAGANVVVNDICRNRPTVPYSLATENELRDVATKIKKLSRDSMYIKADVSNSSDVKDMIDKVIDVFGRIDILINNAGIGYEFTYLWNIDENVWNDVIDVNLKSTFLCCKYVIPHMIERKYGRIINTSSVSAIKGGCGGAHYSAAKSAIIGLTKSLAAELRPYNITVNAICPGPVDTSMTHGFKKQTVKLMKRIQQIMGSEKTIFDPSALILKPEEVSNVVVWLSSDFAAAITGAVVLIDKGYLCR